MKNKKEKKPLVNVEQEKYEFNQEDFEKYKKEAAEVPVLMDPRMFYNYNDVDRLRNLLLICPQKTCEYSEKSI